MRTIGQILKQEREAKFYSLEEIEKATKIRKELLDALEKDEIHKLPPPTFVQGFIKNYGKFLGLDPNKLMAIYKRDFSDRKNPPKIMQSFSSPMNKSNRLQFTPAKFLAGIIFILVLIFFVYLWIEYRLLSGAPFLDVTQPVDQISVSTPAVTVSGRTDPEAKVSINNQEIQIDLSGKFSQEIKLSESANTITVSAVSKSGKSSKIERKVFLKNP